MDLPVHESNRWCAVRYDRRPTPAKIRRAILREEGVHSGFSVLTAPAPAHDDTAFVVLTVHESGERVFSAMRAGASGYLLKSSPPAEILAGLRSVRDGGAPLSPAVASMVWPTIRWVTRVTCSSAMASRVSSSVAWAVRVSVGVSRYSGCCRVI